MGTLGKSKLGIDTPNGMARCCFGDARSRIGFRTYHATKRHVIDDHLAPQLRNRHSSHHAFCVDLLRGRAKKTVDSVQIGVPIIPISGSRRGEHGRILWWISSPLMGMTILVIDMCRRFVDIEKPNR